MYFFYVKCQFFIWKKLYYRYKVNKLQRKDKRGENMDNSRAYNWALILALAATAQENTSSDNDKKAA